MLYYNQLGAYLFSKERWGVHSDGKGGWEKMGGIEGGGMAIRIYNVRKKVNFQ